MSKSEWTKIAISQTFSVSWIRSVLESVYQSVPYTKPIFWILVFGEVVIICPQKHLAWSPSLHKSPGRTEIFSRTASVGPVQKELKISLKNCFDSNIRNITWEFWYSIYHAIILGDCKLTSKLPEIQGMGWGSSPMLRHQTWAFRSCDYNHDWLYLAHSNYRP